MAQAHVSTSEIIAKIRQNPGKYLLSGGAIVQLKRAGVPDEVIAAMQDKAASSDKGSNPASQATGTLTEEEAKQIMDERLAETRAKTAQYFQRWAQDANKSPAAQSGHVDKPAQSPGVRSCPFSGPLSLQQILQMPDDVPLVPAIKACHVNFQLDIVTMDRLEPMQMGAVLTAVYRDTVSRLSLKEAQDQVSSVEAFIREGASGAPKNPPPTLAKIIANGDNAKSSIPAVPAKGEFETTEAYQNRIKNARTSESQIDSSTNFYVRQYYAAYSSYAEFLKEAIYLVPDSAIYVNYNADSAQLTATLSGATYIFSGIPGPVAKTFKDAWDHVQVRRKYNEDISRVLYLQTTEQSIAGWKSDMARDLAASEIFLDGETGLTWTDVNRPDARYLYVGAQHYCQTLKIKGLAGWRVPSADEYSSLVNAAYPESVKPGLHLSGTTEYWTSSYPSSAKFESPDIAGSPQVYESSGPYRFRFQDTPGADGRHMYRSEEQHRAAVMCVR